MKDAKPGALVWARIAGLPCWPGQVLDPDCVLAQSPQIQRRRTNKAGTVLVSFFGDSTYNWLDQGCLDPFEAFYEKRRTQPVRQKNLQETFVLAVEEAREVWDRREGREPKTDYEPIDFLRPETWPLPDGPAVLPGLPTAEDWEQVSSEQVLAWLRTAAANPWNTPKVLPDATRSAQRQLLSAYWHPFHAAQDAEREGQRAEEPTSSKAARSRGPSSKKGAVGGDATEQVAAHSPRVEAQNEGTKQKQGYKKRKVLALSEQEEGEEEVPAHASWADDDQPAQAAAIKPKLKRVKADNVGERLRGEDHGSAAGKDKKSVKKKVEDPGFQGASPGPVAPKPEGAHEVEVAKPLEVTLEQVLDTLKAAASSPCHYLEERRCSPKLLLEAEAASLLFREAVCTDSQVQQYGHYGPAARRALQRCGALPRPDRRERRRQREEREGQRDKEEKERGEEEREEQGKAAQQAAQQHPTADEEENVEAAAAAVPSSSEDEGEPAEVAGRGQQVMRSVPRTPQQLIDLTVSDYSGKVGSKDQFETNLQRWYGEHGLQMGISSLAGQQLDMYTIFKEVADRGGFSAVDQTFAGWRHVVLAWRPELHDKRIKAQRLRGAYRKHLLKFEKYLSTNCPTKTISVRPAVTRSAHEQGNIAASHFEVQKKRRLSGPEDTVQEEDGQPLKKSHPAEAVKPLKKSSDFTRQKLLSTAEGLPSDPKRKIQLASSSFYPAEGASYKTVNVQIKAEDAPAQVEHLPVKATPPQLQPKEASRFIPTVPRPRLTVHQTQPVASSSGPAPNPHYKRVMLKYPAGVPLQTKAVYASLAQKFGEVSSDDVLVERNRSMVTITFATAEEAMLAQQQLGPRVDNGSSLPPGTVKVSLVRGTQSTSSYSRTGDSRQDSVPESRGRQQDGNGYNDGDLRQRGQGRGPPRDWDSGRQDYNRRPDDGWHDSNGFGWHDDGPGGRGYNEGPSASDRFAGSGSYRRGSGGRGGYGTSRHEDMQPYTPSEFGARQGGRGGVGYDRGPWRPEEQSPAWQRHVNGRSEDGAGAHIGNLPQDPRRQLAARAGRGAPTRGPGAGSVYLTGAPGGAPTLLVTQPPPPLLQRPPMMQSNVIITNLPSQPPHHLAAAPTQASHAPVLLTYPHPHPQVMHQPPPRQVLHQPFQPAHAPQTQAFTIVQQPPGVFPSAAPPASYTSRPMIPPRPGLAHMPGPFHPHLAAPHSSISPTLPSQPAHGDLLSGINKAALERVLQQVSSGNQAERGARLFAATSTEGAASSSNQPASRRADWSPSHSAEPYSPTAKQRTASRSGSGSMEQQNGGDYSPTAARRPSPPRSQEPSNQQLNQLIALLGGLVNKPL